MGMIGVPTAQQRAEAFDAIADWVAEQKEKPAEDTYVNLRALVCALDPDDEICIWILNEIKKLISFDDEYSHTPP